MIFPFALRIFLIPELNILSVHFHSDGFTTDEVLGGLIFNDQGKSIAVKDMKQILAQSEERVYLWLHNLAGFHLDQ